MKGRLALFAGLGALTLVLAGAAFADHPGRGGAALGAQLTGGVECNFAGVCGLGDLDASGSIMLRLNPGQQEICFDVQTTGAAPFFASHIHRAPAGVAGPVVVPTTGAFAGSTSACVSAARDLIVEIIRHPERFYYNAHNTAFPGGAVRGQLERVSPGQSR